LAGANAVKLSTDLIRFGGGDAQIRTHSSDDGSGSIAMTWQSPSRWEVDRVGFTELLVVEYSNPQSQPMACAIIRSASLLDEVANITVTNINMAAKKPYAVVRNVYGNERNIRVHDFATRDGGRVEAITRKYVEIIELLPNSTGGWRESLIRLPLAGTRATKSD
jgi:Pilus assembly protein, PilP